MPRIPKFHPRRRLALLINQLDRSENCFSHNNPNKSVYHRLVPQTRGNKGVYTMEAALRRGSLDLRSDICHVLATKTQLGLDEARKRAENVAPKVMDLYKKAMEEASKQARAEALMIACERVITGEVFSDPYSISISLECLTMLENIGTAWHRAPSDITYEDIRKIFPDEVDVKADTYRILADYARIADNNTLTVLFARAHGDTSSMGILPYTEILDRLDQIQGKKVIMVLACFSGALHNYVARRPNPEDYVVITSTTAKRPGINWNEDAILHELTEVIKAGNPLSSFGEARIFSNRGSESQATIASFPFDVVL